MRLFCYADGCVSVVSLLQYNTRDTDALLSFSDAGIRQNMRVIAIPRLK